MASLTRTLTRPCLRVSPRLALCTRHYSTEGAAHHDECDVVIVGGGPAGLALAHALGSSEQIRSSQKVVLVEASDLGKVRDWSLPSDSFSNRVSSITNASRGFLTDTGAWSHVEVDRTNPMEGMQVWDGVSDARITFDASELHLTSSAHGGMATMTENLNIQRALLRGLATIPEVELVDKVKVGNIEHEEREGGGWPMVHLSNGRSLRARLLVGADGFNSPVRAYAGISSYGWSYNTQAIVATLVHPPRNMLQAPNTVAYQRFLPTGPIAFLPLSPTVSSLVWSTTPALAAALTSAASDSAALVHAVNAAFRLPYVSLRYLNTALLDAHAAGAPLSPSQLADEIAWRERSHGIDSTSAYASAHMAQDIVAPSDAQALPPLISSVQPGTVASFPLRYNHADAYIGEGAGARTVLVGDAAHTVHPLAGQGLNLGLGDVEALTRCIRDALQRGGDIGSRTALQPYARARYFENHKVMSAVDKLHKLYSTTAAPVVWARSVGLEVINELDTLKAALMFTAGAQARSTKPTSPWNVVAGGVEGLMGTLGAAKIVGGLLQSAAGRGLQEVGKMVAGDRR